MTYERQINWNTSGKTPREVQLEREIAELKQQRASIEQAERQEPVGEVRDMKYGAVRFYGKPTERKYLPDGTKLYTTPQPATPVWQPIETAPKDGTVFLGYRDGRMREAYRVPRDDCEMWVFGGSSGSVEIAPQLKPTHWMPLLAAPKPGENHD